MIRSVSPPIAPTYDAGALIAFERNDRTQWGRLAGSIANGLLPVIPAPVLTQVWRSGRQVSLARALKSCTVEAVDEHLAKAAGALCASARTSDAVDAIVVASAARRGSTVVTSDIDDISRLAAHVKGVKVDRV
jgi:hypothetical protein